MFDVLTSSTFTLTFSLKCFFLKRSESQEVTLTVVCLLITLKLGRGLADNKSFFGFRIQVGEGSNPNSDVNIFSNVDLLLEPLNLQLLSDYVCIKHEK